MMRLAQGDALKLNSAVLLNLDYFVPLGPLMSRSNSFAIASSRSNLDVLTKK